MRENDDKDIAVLGEIGGYKIISPPPDIEHKYGESVIPAILVFVDRNITPSFIGVTANSRIISHSLESISVEDLRDRLSPDCIICSESPIEKDNLSDSISDWTFAKMGFHKDLTEDSYWSPLLGESSYLLICPNCTRTLSTASEEIINTYKYILISQQL